MDRKENLRNLIFRLKNNNSDQELADKMGVSQFSINSWKNKTHFPSVKYLKKIADYMGISIDQLLSQLSEESYRIREIKDVDTAQGIFTYANALSFDEKILLIKLIVDSLKKD